jgi:hypothetical protein
LSPAAGNGTVRVRVGERTVATGHVGARVALATKYEDDSYGPNFIKAIKNKRKNVLKIENKLYKNLYSLKMRLVLSVDHVKFNV